MSVSVAVARLLSLGLLFASCARGQLIFSDNFNSGASAQWGNQLGNWSASGGVYDSASPSNSPATYTLLPYTLTDFTLTVTINAVQDGGIWLRASDNNHAILLITGGHGLTGTGLYWHEINGSISGPLNEMTGLFTSGVSNATITVTAIGDTYSAFVNGSTTPATTLTSSIFTSGFVGLYDFSPQTFDNFSVTAIPEPPATALAAGLAILLATRWLRRRPSAMAAPLA